PRLPRRRPQVLGDGVDLVGDHFQADSLHATDPDGVLRRQGHDDAGPIDAAGAEGLYVGLDAGATAGIAAGDGAGHSHGHAGARRCSRSRNKNVKTTALTATPTKLLMSAGWSRKRRRAPTPWGKPG